MSDLWYGTSGPRDAKIAIVGESWGAEEARKQQPFVGTSGNELTNMLSEAGISRNQCFLTNVVPKQPPRNEMQQFFHLTKEAKEYGGQLVKGLYPQDLVINGMMTLHEQLKRVDPEVIIAFGNYSLWALTDDCFDIRSKKGYRVPAGITKWRGSQLYWNGIKMVPTYHPAAILRQWEWRAATMNDLRMRVGAALDGSWKEPEYNFIIRPSFDAVTALLSGLLEKLKQGKVKIAVDIETRGGHIACIGLGTSPIDAICIPLMCVENPRGYWLPHEETVILQLLRQVLMHPNAFIIGQNFNYDLQYIALFLQIVPLLSFDTMVAQHVCWPGIPKGLEFLSSMYCRFHRYWKDEGKNWDAKVPEDVLWKYNCLDCVATFEAAQVLRQIIKQFDLMDQFIEQMKFALLALRMMFRGVRIDARQRAISAFEVNAEIAKREEWLENILSEKVAPRVKGRSPWYRSPMQLQAILYDRLQLPVIRDSKTKRPTTNDEAIRQLMDREILLRPILRTIQEYRSLNVFFTNFITAPLDPDHRMRCGYKAAGPETYRWASGENAFGRGANLQAIPKGTEDE